ncbi:MAG: hypothetical protein JXR96_13485 [Deltaproteobacteria bacterium]|nr:hypothetical protein [Deltaproteobacteria bacterium]
MERCQLPVLPAVIVFTGLLLCPRARAEVYYVDGSLAADCAGGAGTSYSVAARDCSASDGTIAWQSLEPAHAVLVAGDTVFIRAGTYDISGNAINPVHSGTSADARITYSGYESEDVILNGDSDNCIGVYLMQWDNEAHAFVANSYVQITKLTFQNFYRYLYIYNGGDAAANYNEIAYCTFKDQRDVWSDVVASGTHAGASSCGANAVLTHADDGSGSTYQSYRVRNTSTGAACQIAYGGATSTSKTCATSVGLFGGVRNGAPDDCWEDGDGYEITRMIYWGGGYIQNSGHNYLHHNTMCRYGAYSELDEGVVLEVGVGNEGSTDASHFNTIEDNHFYAGGHHVLGVNTCKHCVIRNNYVHNEGWWDASMHWDASLYAGFDSSLLGYRAISAVGSPANAGQSLWEGNRVGYGAAYGGPHLGLTGGSGSGTTLSTSNNIYRYNDHFANALFGLRLAASIGTSSGNRVYNNTFYKNGWGSDDDDRAYDNLRMGMSFYVDSCAEVFDTDVRNNLFFDHWTTAHKPQYEVIHLPGAELATCNTISDNFDDDTVDPLFVEPDISTPLETSLPDLSLQPSSPAIDQGARLTRASHSGSSSTALVVDDASFFQDGTWGSDLARATLEADWIAIGEVDHVVQIVSIDYTTNTITLASPMTWAEEAPVWLYRKSDGEVVLHGSAPDMGAHEYRNAAPPPDGGPEPDGGTDGGAADEARDGGADRDGEPSGCSCGGGRAAGPWLLALLVGACAFLSRARRARS